MGLFSRKKQVGDGINLETVRYELELKSKELSAREQLISEREKNYESLITENMEAKTLKTDS